LQEVLGYLLYRPPGTLLDSGPVRGAQAIDTRRLRLCTYVSAEAVALIRGHEEPVSLGVVHLQILTIGLIHVQMHQALEDPYTVLYVHHIVSGLDV
jgi:hypothetical protein